MATLSATLLQMGLPWPVTILAMLALGAALGALQGYFVAYEGIPAFIVTLAGLSVIRGVALLITGGYSIPVDPASPFIVIGRAWFLGVPVPALIALVILAIAYLVFNETPFGRYVTGIGANAEAVRRAGVNTRLTTLFVYVISAASAALAGIILAARLGSGSSNAGQGFELEVIAAVVLGGTSLFGGRGTIIGHRARRAHRRGHRQRPDPRASVAVPDADRDGNHHPDRHLAELPHLPRRRAEPLSPMNSFSTTNPPGRGSRSASRPAQVMTVLGPVPVEDMGITLMHEHILLDGARTWKCPCHPDEKAIAEQPVNIEIIGELRMNPYMNRDNVSLDDADLALSELKRYQALGGHTVVDATNIGIGREPEKLARISRMSGLKIVMGTGFYLEHTHPEWLKAMDVDAVTEFIVNEVGGGETQPAILAGLIGEIGVSKDFTAEELKVADGLGAGVAHHRRAAVDPSARLGAAGAQGARRRRSGGRRSSRTPCSAT